MDRLVAALGARALTRVGRSVAYGTRARLHAAPLHTSTPIAPERQHSDCTRTSTVMVHEHAVPLRTSTPITCAPLPAAASRRRERTCAG
jgi:hypothetical protein